MSQSASSNGILTSQLSFQRKRRILLALIFSLFCLLFVRGMQLHLKKEIDMDRMRVHAIPIALSVLYHHHPHDYTGLRDIAMQFQGGSQSLANMIVSAKTQIIGQDKGVYYWTADDKGLEDYVIAAFTIFGLHVDSLYYMWFLILLISISLFLVPFHRRISALGVLCLILLSIHVAITALPLSKAPLTSIYESRFFDVLALPAVVHMLFISQKRVRFNWFRDYVPLIGQILIFTFLYHCRSSLGWEIVSVYSFCALVMANRLYRNHRKKIKGISTSKLSVMPPFLVCILLAMSLTGLNVYKKSVYNPHYFSEMGSRTVWHNALIGLGQEDSYISTKYKIPVDQGPDTVIAAAVINYAKNKGKCSADIAGTEAAILMGSLGNHAQANWKSYERCAKSFYLSIASDNKLRFSYLYGIKKPYVSLRNLMLWSQESGIGWHPFSIINACFFLMIVSLACKAMFRERNRLVIMSMLILAYSLVPSVAFYHGVLAQGGMLALTALFLYLMFIFIFNVIFLRLKSKFFQSTAASL